MVSFKQNIFYLKTQTFSVNITEKKKTEIHKSSGKLKQKINYDAKNWDVTEKIDFSMYLSLIQLLV